MGKGPGVGETVIGGLAGRTAADITGGSDVARAAGRAALDRESMGKSYYNWTVGQGNRMTGTANEFANSDDTMAGLNAMSNSIKTQEMQVGRAENLMKNLDPALMEASQQALKLMRGEQANSLAPMQAQRTVQRQKLMDNLRSQLGAGAETSSIGQAALQKFDMDTNSQMAQLQQGALGNLNSFLGTQAGVRSSLSNENSRLSGLGSNIGQYQNMRNQMVQNGYTNSAGLVNQGWQAKMGNAGAAYAGPMYQAMATQQGAALASTAMHNTGQTMMSIFGGMAGGMPGMGGMSGGGDAASGASEGYNGMTGGGGRTLMSM